MSLQGLHYLQLNDTGPGYLNDYLLPYELDCQLKSASEMVVHVGSPSKIRKASAGTRAFSVVAP